MKQSINNLVALIAFFMLCWPLTSLAKFIKCSDKQIDTIKKAQSLTQSLSLKLQEDIQATLENSEKVERKASIDKRLLQSYRFVECAIGHMGDLDYQCMAKEKHYAALINWMLGTRIKLAPIFFRYSENMMAATLLHEFTHKCGTTDAAYFRDGKTPKNIGPIHWPSIADTYQYWLTKGFCIPEENCQTQTK